MSHVETARVSVVDLKALKAACTRLGVEFVEGKKTYNFYGRHVGDYPLPAGFTAAEMGKCEHAIKVPGVHYEIGVAPSKNGKGYTLLYDFYGSGSNAAHDGEKLLKKFGQGLTKLVDAYSIEALKAQARAKGYMTQESVLSNGKTKLVVTGFAS